MSITSVALPAKTIHTSLYFYTKSKPDPNPDTNALFRYLLPVADPEVLKKRLGGAKDNV